MEIPAPGNPEKKQSFWGTTTGFITKIAAFLTAITALVVAFRNFNDHVVRPTQHLPPKTDASINPPKEPTTFVPDNSEPVTEKSPDLRISAFSINPRQIDLDEDAKPKPIDVLVEAHNNGDATATNCKFVMVTDKGILVNNESASFSLDPGEKREMHLNVLISQTGKLKATLISDGGMLETGTVDVVVYPHGAMHIKPIF